MRIWVRAERTMKCGYCYRRWITRGELMLKIQLPKMHRDLIRCLDCAGEAAPNLPPLIEPPTRVELNLPPSRPITREWLPYKETVH